MEKLNNVDARKFYEYKEILEVLRDTVSENDPVEIRLNNPTLRTMAGYTEKSNEQNFNPLVKKYMDKLAFDTEKEKASMDKNAVQGISDELMNMAGYMDGNNENINEYAKSFVDRKLIESKLDRLYDALEQQDDEAVTRIYKDIYMMTSYSNNRPFGVVNEYAQTFVDARLKEFTKRGIHTKSIENR